MIENAASRTSVDDVVLLPCPFCGSKELNGPHISEYVGDRYSPLWWVDCRKCPGGMEVKGEDVQGLVDAWNKRADYKDAEMHSTAELIADLLAGYQLAVNFADSERKEDGAAGPQDHIAFGFGMAVRRAQEFVNRNSR